MVGYEPTQGELTKSELAFASTMSGFLSRIVIQPFDVLKIRFQIQHEPISLDSHHSKYKSLFQAVKSIFKEEGLISFWKGHFTGQMLSTTYSFVQFTSFEILTKYAFEMAPSTFYSYKTMTHFVCGGVSASIATIVNQPIDTLRTRFVAQGEPKIYKSIPHACANIYKTEGLIGFYKGLIPSIILVAPQSAITFSVYTILNSYWDKIFTNHHNSLALKSSINGALSGIIAKTVFYPFDVVKKRLQVQGFEEARANFGKTAKYNGLVDCFIKIKRQEGLRGLYKGYNPNMLKAGVSTGTILLLYEEITQLLRFIKTIA